MVIFPISQYAFNEDRYKQKLNISQKHHTNIQILLFLKFLRSMDDIGKYGKDASNFGNSIKCESFISVITNILIPSFIYAVLIELLLYAY